MTRRQKFEEIEKKLGKDNEALRNKLMKDGWLSIKYKQVEEYFRVLNKGEEPSRLLVQNCDGGLQSIESWLSQFE